MAGSGNSGSETHSTEGGCHGTTEFQSTGRVGFLYCDRGKKRCRRRRSIVLLHCFVYKAARYPGIVKVKVNE